MLTNEMFYCKFTVILIVQCRLNIYQVQLTPAFFCSVQSITMDSNVK